MDPYVNVVVLIEYKIYESFDRFDSGSSDSSSSSDSISSPDIIWTKHVICLGSVDTRNSNEYRLLQLLAANRQNDSSSLVQCPGIFSIFEQQNRWLVFPTLPANDAAMDNFMELPGWMELEEIVQPDARRLLTLSRGRRTYFFTLTHLHKPEEVSAAPAPAAPAPAPAPAPARVPSAPVVELEVGALVMVHAMCRGEGSSRGEIKTLLIPADLLDDTRVHMLRSLAAQDFMYEDFISSWQNDRDEGDYVYDKHALLFMVLTSTEEKCDAEFFSCETGLTVEYLLAAHGAWAHLSNTWVKFEAVKGDNSVLKSALNSDSIQPLNELAVNAVLPPPLYILHSVWCGYYNFEDSSYGLNISLEQLQPDSYVREVDASLV